MATDNLGKADALLLSPLLEAGELEKARELARVGPLGEGLELESYSGFITVDKAHGSNMFFWYFPSFNNAEIDPLLLHVEGGPGASLLLSLFAKGPLLVEDGEVGIREKSWASNSSMLYVDIYMGAGYSYTEKEEGNQLSSASVAESVYEFLCQFYQLFPERLSNNLLIAGDSFGAHVGAPIAKLINNKNEEKSGPEIKLYKIVFYVPWIDPMSQFEYSSLCKILGLVGSKEAAYMKSEEENIREFIRQEKYVEAFQNWYSLTSTYFPKVSGFSQPMNVLEPKQNVYGMGCIALAETPEFRDAIHVGQTPFAGAVNFAVLERMAGDIVQSVKSDVEALLTAKIPVYLIAGQFDLSVTAVGVQNLVENLTWPEKLEFENAERHIWMVEDDIAGYRKDGGNLTHVMMRNAGHIMVVNQPLWCAEIIAEALQPKDNN